MIVRNVGLALVLLVCMGGVALGASLTWTGDGANALWSTEDNWSGICGSSPCYPKDSTDDATIDGDDDPDLVDIVTVTIDDLTINGDVDFDSAAETEVISVDSLTINGEAVVNLTSAAKIQG